MAMVAEPCDGGADSVAEAPHEWQLPADLVSSVREHDFRRLTELQSELKRRCQELLKFVQRDFKALAEVSPELADACRGLANRGLAETIEGFAPRIEALARRVEQHEKLRIVFIGPVKAGKSTLINIILSGRLPAKEMILPVDNLAATNCIWKVESCDGSVAEVLLEGIALQSWQIGVAGVADGADARLKIAEFLEDNLDRHARPEDRREVTLRLPLPILDPFGCHYSLVDTPGFTESAEYEEMVMKFLQDHSHIACMVCPLTEGLALPQATKNLLQRSYSHTFWVLTRYDDILLRRAKSRKSQRESAELVVEKFSEQIHAVHPDAKIFRHAGQVLAPEEAPPGWLDLAERHLPADQAAEWLAEICAHLKHMFIAIQQEQLVLCSQSRQAMDISVELIREYSRLKDGTQGKLAASDHYMRELHIGAEEAAKMMEKEIRQEIDLVKTSELERHCHHAAAYAMSRGAYGAQAAFYDEVLTALVPRVEGDLRSRIDAVLRRAQHRVADIARRLVEEAGIEIAFANPPDNRHEVSAPAAGHLKGRYPLESVTVLSVAAAGQGAVLASETGAALLCSVGLRLGTGAIFGAVGVAIVSFAALGLAVKAAADVNPFWSYKTVERDIIKKMRNGNHWGVLAEAAAGRACAHLLSCAAQLRCAFSKALLIRGTPRQVLIELFPDLNLFEAIRVGVERTCADIADFVSAPCLAGCAASDSQEVAKDMRRVVYSRVIEATAIYVSPNSRTDTILGETLSALMLARCRALVASDGLGEARNSAVVFCRMFPRLLLPRVYELGARIVFEFRAGSLCARAAREDARRIACKLQGWSRQPDMGGRRWREVPVTLEVWFFAVLASFLGSEGRREHLPKLLLNLDHYLLLLVNARRPSWAEICQRRVQERMLRLDSETSREEVARTVLGALSAKRPGLGDGGLPTPRGFGWRRGAADDMSRIADDVFSAASEEYRGACRTLIGRVVRGIQSLLLALPTSQLDVEDIGAKLAARVFTRLAEVLTGAPELPSELTDDIASGLCPSEVPAGFCEEWHRLLIAAHRRPASDPAARVAEVSDEGGRAGSQGAGCAGGTPLVVGGNSAGEVVAHGGSPNEGGGASVPTKAVKANSGGGDVCGSPAAGAAPPADDASGMDSAAAPRCCARAIHEVDCHLER